MRLYFIRLLYRLAPLLDLLLAPLSLLSSAWSLFVRSAGFERMPLAKRIYLKTGVVPVRRHYYEPFFDPADFRLSLEEDRMLPGIDLGEMQQLALLDNLHYQDELLNFPVESDGQRNFYYNNEFFAPGDAEFLYAMVRYFRPRRIFEVGSGNSTLMILNALAANRKNDPEYECDLTCIEPYESPWLEERGVTVLRKRVEEMDAAFFSALKSGDILFIDSSHVIKPQGDILHLYLHVLPLLQSGVFVHIHDIMTPRDYFHHWVADKLQFWNEQYVLEAFLSMNKDFSVIAALNFLKHHHFERLAAVCPILSQQPASEPGSFWLRRL
jgi:predicted O-methyltransferase YrrM